MAFVLGPEFGPRAFHVPADGAAAHPPFAGDLGLVAAAEGVALGPSAPAQQLGHLHGPVQRLPLAGSVGVASAARPSVGLVRRNQPFPIVAHFLPTAFAANFWRKSLSDNNLSW